MRSPPINFFGLTRLTPDSKLALLDWCAGPNVVHTNPSTGFDNCHGANPTSSNISQSAVLDWRKCEKRRYWLRESARKIRARRNSRAIVSIFSSWELRVHSMKISDCGMRIADLNGACGVAGIGVTTLAEWRASQPDLEARMSEARERTRQKATASDQRGRREGLACARRMAATFIPRRLSRQRKQDRVQCDRERIFILRHGRKAAGTDYIELVP